jgi:hypothetical protein
MVLIGLFTNFEFNIYENDCLKIYLNITDMFVFDEHEQTGSI